MKPFLKTLAIAGTVAVSLATATLAFAGSAQAAEMTFIDVHNAADSAAAMDHVNRVKPIAAKYGVTLTQVYDVRNVNAGMQPGEWMLMFQAPSPQALARMLNDEDYLASTATDSIHSITPARHFLLTPMETNAY